MPTDFKLFEALENEPGKLKKIELLKGANETEKELIRLAVDPDILFRLQKIDYPPEHESGTPEVIGVEALFKLADFLSKKKALTNEDRWYIGDFLWWTNYKNGPLEAKWFERILLKDLRCGFDVSTVNKAWPGFIKTYDCALADVYDFEKHEELLKNSLVDVKLDGVRCLAKVENGNVTLRSRNGKLITTFPQIEEELAKLPNNVYDGEIYLHGQNAFQTLMKYVKNDKSAPNELDFKFVIFDIVNEEPYWKREVEIVNTLEEVFGSDFHTQSVIWPYGNRLGILDRIRVDSNEKLLELLDWALGLGFEGLMVKDRNAPYKAKRSKNILKVKRFYSSEATVTGMIEGKGRLAEGFNLVPKGDGNGWDALNYDGSPLKETGPTMGALELVMPDGKEFKIGSGFSDELRNEIWQNQEATKGRIVEYKYQELSKDGIPRFPIFLRFREDMEAGL